MVNQQTTDSSTTSGNPITGKPTVGIIDYQMGNLRSVSKGIERAGGRPIVSERFEDFAHATHLILPGVGAFRDAIRELRQRDLVPRIRDWIAADRPFLGICLGLQLLLDVSFEGGEYEGLGIIPGQVVRFQFDKASGGDFGKKSEELTYKVPHMGWNQVNLANKTSQQVPEESMLRGLPTSPYFYFVHSYHAVPKHAEDAWLTSSYGYDFCAAVRRGNLYATQFHPEKSQSAGIGLLRNFLGLSY